MDSQNVTTQIITDHTDPFYSDGIFPSYLRPCGARKKLWAARTFPSKQRLLSTKGKWQSKQKQENKRTRTESHKKNERKTQIQHTRSARAKAGRLECQMLFVFVLLIPLNPLFLFLAVLAALPSRNCRQV